MDSQNKMAPGPVEGVLRILREGSASDIPRSADLGVSSIGFAHRHMDRQDRENVSMLSCKKVVSAREMVRVASLNVGTLTGKSVEVCEMLRRRKVQIGCLQEVRWKKAGVKKLEGYKLFWQGNEVGMGGVAIMVTMEWEDRVVSVERINDRIMIVKIIFGHKMINFVSAYAPQLGI
jgi:hypothetical protein